jgi:hypothetical protein
MFKRKQPATPAKPRPAALRYQLVQPEFATWTAQDVGNLRMFLKTETGQKLVSICGSKIFQQGMKEAHGDALARAAGMDELLIFQFNLASDEQLAKLSEATAAQVAQTTPENAELNDDVTLIRSF